MTVLTRSQSAQFKPTFIPYSQWSKQPYSNLYKIRCHDYEALTSSEIDDIELHMKPEQIGELFEADCWMTYIERMDGDIIMFWNHIDYDSKYVGKEHPQYIQDKKNRKLLTNNPHIAFDMMEEGDELRIIMWSGEWQGIVVKTSTGFSLSFDKSKGIKL